MKKIIFTIIILLLIPIIYVKAYGIENYFINAVLENNGDLIVEEYFNVNGDYNGFERIVNYKNDNVSLFDADALMYGGSNIHNGSGICLLKVASVSQSADYKFDEEYNKVFKKVSDANKGDYGVYTEEKTINGLNIRIYLPSKKHQAFYIKYRLENMAILHDDIGELGWNIFGTELNESIEHLVLNLTVKDNKDLLKVWGHGPLNGETQITSSNTIRLIMNGLNANTAVDIRLAFDKSAISNSSKKTYVRALDKIIKYETQKAFEANQERQQQIDYLKESIIKMFNSLKENPTRSFYNEILIEINKIEYSYLQTELLEKLESFKPLIDETEYTKFKEIFNKKDKITYSDYAKALKYSNNVFDSNLKIIMDKNLGLLKKRVIKYELKINIKYCSIIVILMIVSYAYKVFLKKLSLKKRYYNQVNYIRELPSDLSPGATGLLIDNRLSNDELSATVLDLIKRKLIKFTKKDDGSYDLYCKSVSRESFSNAEYLLVRLLFDKERTVNTKHMPKINNDDYQSWKLAVINELESKSLIKEYKEEDVLNISELVSGFGALYVSSAMRDFSTLVSGIFLGLGTYMIASFLYKRYQERFVLWFNYPILIGLIGYGMFCLHFIHVFIAFAVAGIILTHKILIMVPNRLKLKKTKEGKEETVKWNAFKSFLIDFSRIDLRDINEITLWEEYLIYATALGISKNVIEKMRVKIATLNIDNDMFTDYVIFSAISDINNISGSLSNISNSIVKASIPTITLPTTSSGGWSSGLGDGGGFSGGSSGGSSSGGGSFGGGGGGGRF